MARTLQPDPALGTALRQFRDRAGLSREQLAYQAGITPSALARIELAQSAPAWDTVRRIARALDVTIVVLAAAVEDAER